MKFGNLLVVKLPVIKTGFILGDIPLTSLTGEYKYCVARMDPYTHSNEDTVEKSYKVYLTPVKDYEATRERRAWYCCDIFRDNHSKVIEFTPDRLEEAIQTAEFLNDLDAE